MASFPPCRHSYPGIFTPIPAAKHLLARTQAHCPALLCAPGRSSRWLIAAGLPCPPGRRTGPLVARPAELAKACTGAEVRRVQDAPAFVSQRQSLIRGAVRHTLGRTLFTMRMASCASTPARFSGKWQRSIFPTRNRNSPAIRTKMPGFRHANPPTGCRPYSLIGLMMLSLREPL
jgi:hypothetical protein